MIEERNRVAQIARAGFAEPQRADVQLVDDEIFEAGGNRQARREFRSPEFLRRDQIRLLRPAGVDANPRRTTSGSMTTLQLTVPSKVSAVPGQCVVARD